MTFSTNVKKYPLGDQLGTSTNIRDYGYAIGSMVAICIIYLWHIDNS